MPAGAEISFRVELEGGRPRAKDLLLPQQGVFDRVHQEHDELRALRWCEYSLDQYANALGELSECLSQYSLDHRSLNALKQAEGMLRCEECRRDERTEGPKVLLLLSEARERWEDKSHACHKALREGLVQRLSAPPRPAFEMSIDRIRFTQSTHSKRFLHGDHAGKRIEWLTEQLLAGTIAFNDPSMALNVVYFHGFYRSLNNRHLTAIHQYAQAMERQNQLPKKCCIRVWPLVRHLVLPNIFFGQSFSAMIFLLSCPAFMKIQSMFFKVIFFEYIDYETDFKGFFKATATFFQGCTILIDPVNYSRIDGRCSKQVVYAIPRVG